MSIDHVPPGSSSLLTATEFSLRLVGHSQDGIQAIGSLLAKLAGRSGYNVMTFMTIPATISGGNSVYQLRFGSTPVYSVGDQVDLLVAYHQENWDAEKAFLKRGGVVIFDSEEVKIADEEAVHYRLSGLPLEKLATEAIGHKGKGKNMYTLGLLARYCALDRDGIDRLLQERYGKKAEVLADIRLGYEAGLLKPLFPTQESTPASLGLPKVTVTGKRLVMDGNQAMAYGLLAAGVRYGAGYPITPATPIMEILRAELPKYGGIFLQAEDELAAISAALGMAYGGHLAITPTSGPGLSLKLEALGYGTMAELPLLVVNVQRGGPSTGIPTQVEQSDLLQALWGSHGDSPRPVLAARNVEDCFRIALEAAAIALAYSTPVIILSDQIMANRIEAFPMPDLPDCRPIQPDLSPRPADFKPYHYDRPTRHAPPGSRMEGSSYPTITGLEHGEDGKPNPGPVNHRKMTLRRREKFRQLASRLPAPEVYGEQAGDLLLVGWGSTFGPIRETVDILRGQGRQAGHCHLRHLHPLPAAVPELLSRYKDVVVVEMNDSGLYGSGQLAYHLRAVTCNPRLRSLTKTDGLTFKVGEILDALASRPDEA